MATKPIFDFPVARPVLSQQVNRTFIFSDGSTIVAQSDQEAVDLLKRIQANGGQKP
jgi:hypothetical protein